MTRGTTPTFKITLPFDTSILIRFDMYFIQGKDTILAKSSTNLDEVVGDLVFDGHDVKATLSQEETFLFSSKKRLEIRTRFKFTDDTVGATKPMFLDVYETGGDTDEVI